MALRSKKIYPAPRKASTTRPQPPVTKGILMGELISRYPQATEVLMRHGFHCIGCAVSPYESLEAGAAIHGIPLAPLLKEINQFVTQKKNKR